MASSEGDMTTSELFCHEANVREFNAALREQPDIREFAGALHQAGLIDGLRGAIFTVVSLVRSYALRRLFNRIG
jgi:hypothetical protein